MIGSVLVLDGEQRASLAVVRSLGRRGARVHVAASRPRALATQSRYCASSVTLPPPLDEPDAYADAVRRHANALGVDVLLPITDASLLAVLPARDGIDACLPFVDVDTYRRMADKDLVLCTARRMGMHVPSTVRLASVDDVQWLAMDDIAFPIVIKPARSVVTVNGHAIKLGVRHVATRDDLQRALDALPAAAFPVLLQQRIVGPGRGVFLLVWDDQLIASFAHERLRERPPSGGVSVLCESVAMDQPLLAKSRELLRRFAWRGVAMVEYKIDGATGDAYLMEVNGRFWGSLQLAIDAGVDFPSLLVDVASGQRPASANGYRVGTRSRWWWGDVDHLYARLRRNGDASLPAGMPSRSRAVFEFLRPHRRTRQEILRLDDPKPFVRESIDWLRGL